MVDRRGEGRRLRRVLGVLALLSIVGVGCSSSRANDKAEKAEKAVDGETTTTTVASPGSSTTAPRTDVKSKSKPTTTTTVGSAAAAKRTPDTPPPSLPTDPSKPTLPLSAELKETCVRPGGTQTITIRTEPDSGAGYDSVYSDGKQGMMEGHYGGNNGTNDLDESGTWTDTWVVKPNAPSGKVQVTVLAIKLDYNPAQTVLYFKVADATGKCS